MIRLDITPALDMVQTSLAAQGDPEKAAGMQAYMKTDMPFYGVQKPGRTPILRRLKREFAPSNRAEYVALVTALWELPHREEKYLAQGVGAACPEYIVPESLPLYRRFIVEGAWWDFADRTAHMIGDLVIRYPHDIWPIVDEWVDGDGMWSRRVGIICQVGAREATDADRLFLYCAARSHEKEFFIRKAIGWALRDYAKTDPEAVAEFVTTHRADLSALSYREATKHIGERVS